MPKITYLLFDCDNTLVLSEELAFEACADLSNEILARFDISKRYTGAELIEDFVGQNFRGMLMSLQTKFGFEVPAPDLESYVSQEEDRVIAKLQASAQPCVNCTPELEKVAASGKYGMAVVSSSAYRRVKASVEKVDQVKYFPLEHIFSAATSLEKPTSKPDPAIYLYACKVLGKQPGECLAVEDSKSGATSAIRAGIPTLGYVGSYHGEKKKAEIREMMKGLGVKVIMDDWINFPKHLAEIEAL